MMRSSGAPRFMGEDPFEGIGTRLPPSGAPRLPPEGVGEQLHVVDGRDRNGTAPTPRIRVSTPSVVPARDLLADLVDRADQPAPAPLVEGRPVEHAGRRRRPEPLEAPLEVALVLAAQRVEPERAPHRRRIAPDARRTRASSTSSRSRYASGVHAQHVFQPSACSATSREQPVALAADEDRRRAAAAPPAARCARRPRGGSAPSNVHGPPPSSPRTTSTASRSRASRSPGRRHRHADRLVLGLVPARAEADVEPAAADAVERGERLREHRRRPQRLAEHERAEPRPRHDAARSAASVDDRVEARRGDPAARRTWRGRGTGGRTARASRTRRASAALRVLDDASPSAAATRPATE